MPEQIDNLRKRVLEDQKFRQLLVSQPEKALESVGIKPTHQNVALVRNVIQSINNLYYGFDERDEFIT